MPCIASLPGQPSSPPVVTTPSTTPTPPLTTSPPGHPPITTESQSPPIIGLPTSTSSSLPLALPSVSPSLPSSSTTTSSGIPTSAILSLPTTDTPSISAAPQTVVVFSTAFAPPSSTNGASGPGCRKDGVVLLINLIFSGIVGIFFVFDCSLDPPVVSLLSSSPLSSSPSYPQRDLPSFPSLDTLPPREDTQLY
ncbi:hypothetical protein AN958_11371 [Leucoagaricus sp. SymC.cos]|nr:hypothetical protein AN958_11371 [Leucoagaricus sp. SymC.cos]